MVELSAGARQGDSGGPIFNTQGQLAGVLFGESRGKTSGSYCGRVHLFLASLPREVATTSLHAGSSPEGSPAGGAPRDPFLMARSTVPPVSAAPQAPFVPQPPAFEISPAFNSPRLPAAAPAALVASRPVVARETNEAWPSSNRFARHQPVSQVVAAPSSLLSSWQQVAGESIWDQAKTSLAIVGAMSLLVQGLRFATRG
jgi:hypothetical protein